MHGTCRRVTLPDYLGRTDPHEFMRDANFFDIIVAMKYGRALRHDDLGLVFVHGITCESQPGGDSWLIKVRSPHLHEAREIPFRETGKSPFLTA